MLLPPCGYTFFECSFYVSYRAQNVFKLATEILPAISKLKLLKAKEQQQQQKNLLLSIII